MDADWLRALANAGSAVAAAFAVLIAKEGLDTWRKELSARAHHETARKILAQLFELEEAFKRARQPLALPLESAGRTPVEGETYEERYLRNSLHALAGRWDRLINVLPKWEAAMAEGRALWRNLLEGPANVVRGKIGAFQYNVHIYAAMLQGVIPPSEATLPVLRFLFAGPWPGPDGEMQPDAIAAEFAAAVAHFEDLLAPHVHSKHWHELPRA
jgi:hypothetical protein